MIYGVGTDLCDIRRMSAFFDRRGLQLAHKILRPNEFSEFETRQHQARTRAVQFLASRFAAKEALSKAMGQGFRPPMSWQACEILPDSNGKPILVLHDKLQAWFAQRQLRAHISLTDEHNYALAFVVIECQSTPQSD